MAHCIVLHIGEDFSLNSGISQKCQVVCVCVYVSSASYMTPDQLVIHIEEDFNLNSGSSVNVSLYVCMHISSASYMNPDQLGSTWINPDPPRFNKINPDRPISLVFFKCHRLS